MMIAILNADGFVGSNFCNYFIQHTKHDLVGFFNDNLPYTHVQAAIQSKSRFSYQINTQNVDSDIENRIRLEKPDVILVIDAHLPKCLENDKRTIYIGQDYNRTECHRQFLYSNAFGPRAAHYHTLLRQIKGEAPLEMDKQVIYVKDLFDQFISFLESGGRFASSVGTTLKPSDLEIDIPITQIQVAVQHTRKWYEANTWFTK